MPIHFAPPSWTGNGRDRDDFAANRPSVHDDTSGELSTQLSTQCTALKSRPAMTFASYPPPRAGPSTQEMMRAPRTSRASSKSGSPTTAIGYRVLCQQSVGRFATRTTYPEPRKRSTEQSGAGRMPEPSDVAVRIPIPSQVPKGRTRPSTQAGSRRPTSARSLNLRNPTKSPIQTRQF
jgi:hypothetical protein